MAQAVVDRGGERRRRHHSAALAAACRCSLDRTL
jgi:hypothetical protein